MTSVQAPSFKWVSTCFAVVAQVFRCQPPERRKLGSGHIVLGALREAVDEHRPRLGPIRDQRPIAAGAPLARPRHPLLDHAAAEIGIDQAALGTLDRLAEPGIVDAFLAREPRKVSRLEHPHERRSALKPYIGPGPIIQEDAAESRLTPTRHRGSRPCRAGWSRPMAGRPPGTPAAPAPRPRTPAASSASRDARDAARAPARRRAAMPACAAGPSAPATAAVMRRAASQAPSFAFETSSASSSRRPVSG